jgi:hypothetical protein
MYQRCLSKKLKIYRAPLPKGYPGTMTTARYIIELIKRGAKDFSVRQKAINIYRGYGVKPKNYLGEISALFDWVKNNVRYTKDIFKVELLHSARRMLQLRAGDCDDMTILLGAMLESTGHKVRLVLVGSNPKRRKQFSHIYLETEHMGQWIPLDPTMNKPPGWAPKAVNKMIINIR